MGRNDERPVLDANGLTFGWPGVPLFQSFNLQIHAGVSAVCGDESTGKTTLLRLMAGHLRPSSGTLVLHGPPSATTAAALRRHVFLTEPRSDALDAFSATAWFEKLPTLHPRFKLEAAHALAIRFALEPHLHKPMHMLSTGSKRKVWLSAAFAAGTPLTLLDEPFAALDNTSSGFLRELLEEAARDGDRAWVLADHEPPLWLSLKACHTLNGRFPERGGS